MIPEKSRQALIKKQYRLCSHAAVQICSWTKKVLQNGSACYKQRFYKVHTHRCMQMTPVVLWCNNSCIYCWRPVEYMGFDTLKEEKLLKPEDFVNCLITARKQLLSGFGGRKRINRELLKEALTPDHYAISLSGEPLLYPYLPELVKYLRDKKKARSVFIVSNGSLPEAFEKLVALRALPSQFYISMVAGSSSTYTKIVVPKLKDSWQRHTRFLELLSKSNIRSVARFTLIKGMNDSPRELKALAELLTRNPVDFVEVKAYMFLGYSRKRLTIENMPIHDYVRNFAEKFNELTPYRIIDEHPASRIVLLKNKNSKEKKSLFPLEETN